MSFIEAKNKTNQILCNKHISHKELINGLYAYIATTGKIPFNIHQSTRNQLEDKLTNKLSKLPHKSPIVNKTQYNKLVNNND